MPEDNLKEMDLQPGERFYHFQIIYEVEVVGTTIEDAVTNCATYFGEYGHRLMPDRIVMDTTKMFFGEV